MEAAVFGAGVGRVGTGSSYRAGFGLQLGVCKRAAAIVADFGLERGTLGWTLV